MDSKKLISISLVLILMMMSVSATNIVGNDDVINNFELRPVSNSGINNNISGIIESNTKSLVSFSGYINYNDISQNTWEPDVIKPLPKVLVAIYYLGEWWGQPSWNFKVSGWADIDGYYNIDCELDLPCDIKVYIWAVIEDVVTVQSWGQPYYFYESDEKHVNVGDTSVYYDILLDPKLPNNPKWPNILATVFETYMYIKSNTESIVTDGWNRGLVEVFWPHDIMGNDYHQPLNDNIFLMPDSVYRDNTIQHEYSHAIMESVRGGAIPHRFESSHWATKESSNNFALHEGWPEFINCAVNNKATDYGYYSTEIEGWLDLQNNIERNHWEKYYDYGLGPGGTGDPLDDYDGEFVEGSVASVLWDIYDDTTAIDYRIIAQEFNEHSDGSDLINSDDTRPSNQIIEPTFEEGLQMQIDEIFDVILNYEVQEIIIDNQGNPVVNIRPIEDILEFWDGWFSTCGSTEPQRNTPENLHWMKAIYYNHGIKVDTKGYPENPPSSLLNMDIISSPGGFGPYSGPIELQATQVLDQDSEDLPFLRCIFEYYQDLNRNGLTDDDPNGDTKENLYDWNLIDETTSSFTNRFFTWSTDTAILPNGSPLPDGFYLLRVVVDDDMVETSNKYSSNPIIIDNSAPAAPILVTGPPGLSNINAPSFNWRDGSDDPSGISQYRIIITSTSTGTQLINQLINGATNSYFNSPTLPDDEYSFTIKQKNGVGIWSASHIDPAGYFIIDTTPLPPVTRLMAEINPATPNDVTISWEHSITQDLEHYEIFRSPTYDGTFYLIDDNVHPGHKSWVDQDAAIVDSNDWFYVVIPVDKTGNPSPAPNQKAAKMTIKLNHGWNMASIPLLKSNTRVQWTFLPISGEYDQILTFHPEDFTDPWKKYVPGPTIDDFTHLDYRKGFWIDITTPGVTLLPNTGAVKDLIDIEINSGWEFIGFPLMDDTKTVGEILSQIPGSVSISGGEPNAPYYLATLPETYIMKPGEGYYIYTNQDTVWRIDHSVPLVTNSAYTDTTGPITTAALKSTTGNNGWYRNINVKLSRSDDISGVEASYYEYVSEGVWYQYSEEFSVSDSSVEREMWYGSEDKEGNIESTLRSIMIPKVDSTPPSSPSTISSSPTIGAWSTDNTIDLSWTAGTDACSDVDGYSYVWSHSATTVPDTIVETPLTYINDYPVGCGSWYFHLRTIDNAGNGADIIKHHGPIMIDYLPPTASFEILESDEHIHTAGSNIYFNPGYDSTFKIRISAVDLASGLDRAEGSNAFGDSPTDSTPVNGEFELDYSIETGAGSETILVSIYDLIGNVQTIAIVATPDNEGAITTLNLPNNDEYIHISEELTLHWSITDAISGPSEDYYLQVATDIAFSTLVLDTLYSKTSYTFGGLNDIIYYWRVKAKDNLGTWGSYSSIGKFTIDTAPPVADLFSVIPQGNNPETFQINGHAWDENFKTFKVEVGEDVNPVHWTEVYSSTTIQTGELTIWDTDGFVNGNYLIKLNVKDLADNLVSFTYPITIAVTNSFKVFPSSISVDHIYFVPEQLPTTLTYIMNDQALVTADILDAQNSLVIRLLDGVIQSKGLNSITWVGSDAVGNYVGIDEQFKFKIHIESGTVVEDIERTIYSSSLDLELSADSYWTSGCGPREIYYTISWPEWNRCMYGDFEKYEITMTKYFRSGSGPKYFKSTITKESTDFYESSFTFLLEYAPPNPPIPMPGQWGHYLYEFTLQEISATNIRDSNMLSVRLGYNSMPGMTYWGCPYLEIWNGTDYALDNTILGESENLERSDLFVNDYYKIEEPIVLLNGAYTVSIHEFENEHSYLDQFELITVDHNPDVEIFVQQDGSIFTSKTPITPTRCGPYGDPMTNYLDKINNIDNESIEAFPGTDVLVSFDDEYDLTNGKLLIRSDIKPGWNPDLPINTGGGLSYHEDEGAIEVYMVNPLNNELEYLESIYPRAFWSTDVIDLSDYAYLGNTPFEIHLVWLGHHKVDYIALDTSEPEPIFIQNLSPSLAVHSEAGIMTYNVNLADNQLVDLIPGEYLNLTFPYAPTNLERDIILFTKGYYNYSHAYAEVIVDKTEVDSFEIVTFDMSNSYDLVQGIAEYYIDFGDQTNSGWVSTPIITHEYAIGDQPYDVSAYVKTNEGLLSTNRVNITIYVKNRNPTPKFSIYQEIDVDVGLGGTAGNSIILQISEGGSIINETTLSRELGPRNKAFMTIHRYLDYLDKNYSVKLIYSADQPGANPVWLSFKSGNELDYFKVFKTKDGYHQEIFIDPSYVKNVVQGNTKYFFEASESYDIDGDIVKYSWDPGVIAHQRLEGVVVSYEYLVVEGYTVTLKVTDNNGATSSTSLRLLGDRLTPLLPTLP